ncbi:MAG: ATP-binding protein [Flavobacteriaceae bacterium]
MLNKRLLIKRLLTYNDENSFYDKKRQLNLHTKVGKGKFLKHICALTNANPNNNSYIVVGVEDEDNALTGADFFDDSKIQNLVNAYLHNPPEILYENIPFPKLPKSKVIGLVTILQKEVPKITSFKKTIHKYYSGFTYKRIGSNSSLMLVDFKLKDSNSTIVTTIENSSKNNIKHTLDGVFDFMNRHADNNPNYKVFKEQFVLCWSGVKKTIKTETYYSRVDIEMVTEQVKLFYSSLDEVDIHYNDNSFIITEYISLGLHNDVKRYPLEKKVLHFSDNGNYKIISEFIFKPPQYDKKTLFHLNNSNNALIDKITQNSQLTQHDLKDIIKLPSICLILSLNGFTVAKEKLISIKGFLKAHSEDIYLEYKEVLRILRKVQYH